MYKGHTIQSLFIKGEFSSSPASLVGTGSDYESKGCWCESHCGQEFYILYFFRFSSAPLAVRLYPHK